MAPASCIVHVLQNLRFQLFDAVEFLFVAQFVQEADEDALAVEVAVEIEQVDFEFLRTVVADGGVEAEAGDAAPRAERAVRFDDEHAAEGVVVGRELDVGGGGVDGAAEFLAVFDFAAQNVIMSQEFFGVFQQAV